MSSVLVKGLIDLASYLSVHVVNAINTNPRDFLQHRFRQLTLLKEG